MTAVDVLDPSEQSERTHQLKSGQPFDVRFEWQLDGVGTQIVGGFWLVSLYVEEFNGASQEIGRAAQAPPIPIVAGASPLTFTWTFRIELRREGIYQLTATINHSPTGNPEQLSEMTGFAESGPIQIGPADEGATAWAGRIGGPWVSPPLTAADMLREEAPEPVRLSEEIGSRLTEQAEQIAQFAQEHGIWVPPGPGEQEDRAALPYERVQWWLRGSGLLGTSVTRRAETGEYTPVIFVRIGRPRMETSADPEGPIDLRDHWRLLRHVGIEPGTTILIGLPEPVAQVGPADPAFCNAPPGTFGARAHTASGGRGLLTAGHVAPITQSSAYTSANSLVGTVIASLDIATLPAGQPGFDIALVELAVSVLDTGPIQPSSLVPRPARIGDNIIGYGRLSNGVQSRLITAGTPVAGPNWAAGAWDNASITARHISTGGDSGGMVLDSGTRQLIGHIVGGYPGVYSIIQDAQAQLQALGSALR